MILIRFPNEDAKDRALELLLGEYRFKSWKSGELLLPEEAHTGIPGTVLPP